MPKFITIGYGDQAGYDGTAQNLKSAAHAHDAQLLAMGALIGRAGNPVQVRNHDDRGAQIESGPFMSSDLPIAGFMVIDAIDIEEAIRLVAKVPCAIAQGVVEVWPLVTS